MALDDDPPALLKPAEAAQRLGISMQTLSGLVRAGRIRFIDVGCGKVNALRRYDPADLDDFITSNRRTVSPPPTKTFRPVRSKTQAVSFSNLAWARAQSKLEESMARKKAEEKASLLKDRPGKGRL